MDRQLKYEKIIMEQEICNGLLDGTAKFSECGLCTGDIKKKCFIKSGMTKGEYIRTQTV